jgi:hypothetical protein
LHRYRPACLMLGDKGVPQFDALAK